MATKKFPMLNYSPSYYFTQYIVLPFKIGYVHIIITTVWLSISVGRGTGDSRVTVQGMKRDCALFAKVCPFYPACLSRWTLDNGRITSGPACTSSMSSSTYYPHPTVPTCRIVYKNPHHPQYIYIHTHTRIYIYTVAVRESTPLFK